MTIVGCEFRHLRPMHKGVASHIPHIFSLPIATSKVLILNPSRYAGVIQSLFAIGCLYLIGAWSGENKEQTL